MVCCESVACGAELLQQLGAGGAVLVDEAGACTELQALVPLATARAARVVLCECPRPSLWIRDTQRLSSWRDTF